MAQKPFEGQAVIGIVPKGEDVVNAEKLAPAPSTANTNGSSGFNWSKWAPTLVPAGVAILFGFILTNMWADIRAVRSVTDDLYKQAAMTAEINGKILGELNGVHTEMSSVHTEMTSIHADMKDMRTQFHSFESQLFQLLSARVISQPQRQQTSP